MASEDEVVIDLRKMKIPELKKELQLRSLKTTGNKQDLIDRLQQYLEEHEGAELADDEILKEDEVDADDRLLTDDKKLDSADDSVLTAQTEEKTPKRDLKRTQPNPVAESESTKKEEIKAEDEKATDNATDAVADLHSPSGLSDKQKLEIRAKKFGMSMADMNPEARKVARSERFGTGSLSSSVPSADPDKLKKRAERFGGVVSATLSKSDEQDRIRKRQARFGIETAGGGLVDNDEKKRKRAERFGTSVA